MKATPQATKKFPDVLSLVLGATLTAVVLIAVYFVLPAKRTEDPVDPNTSSPPPSSESSSSSNLNSESADSTPDSTTIRKFSDLLDKHSSRFLRFSTLYELANRLDEDRLVFLIDEIVDFELDATTQNWRTDALLILMSKLVHFNVE